MLPIISTSVVALYSHCVQQVLTNSTPQQSNTHSWPLTSYIFVYFISQGFYLEILFHQYSNFG